MKNMTSLLRLALSFVLLTALRTSAVVFTTNTDINPLNTSFDGGGIIISNCTVTVDGPHTFSCLVVGTNGTLTHTFCPNGILSVATNNVTNEPLVLNSTNPTVLFSTNILYTLSPPLVTDPTQTITYTNNADYVVINASNETEIQLTTNSTIPEDGTVLVSYSWTYEVTAGLDLSVTGAVCVALGGSIDANGIGYGPATGPGAGTNSAATFFDGSGGGDGGGGGNSASNAVGGVCYDSLYQPASLGSGGGASYAGSGGNGGGLVQITAGGNVDVEGVISANGANAYNSRAGGGSGGGIWISAASISGAGSITANGGSGAPGFGGGGGGGRIAIVCATNNFAGSMNAFGGNGATDGGAGTVFTETSGQLGLLTLNNGGNSGADSTVSLPTLANVTVYSNAALQVSGQFSPDNVTIGANSVLTGLPQTILQFACSNLTVQLGGSVSVNGQGNASSGPGLGATYYSNGTYYGGGGGYGGPGGAGAVTNATGGPAYGLTQSPTSLGSAGSGNTSSFGGAGGGAMNLTVSMALELNGSITANGVNGSGLAGGGGSGGSIWITVGKITSVPFPGSITANGGNGANGLGGGGGGGRIAVIALSSFYAGSANCYGGSGANYGGAGTVFFQTGGSSQQLVLDNGGNTGPATPLASASLANLYIQNGAWAVPANNSTFETLTVNSNGWLTSSPVYSGTSFSITGFATFQAGGGFNANSDGYGPNQEASVSPQYQQNFPYAAGGGGHGGSGGAGGTNSTAGGAGYDSVSSPDFAGGGGGGYSPYSLGGMGGGVVRMTVGGVLTVNGVISANGGNGSGDGGGGGAGGGIYISALTITGAGAVTANGGSGVPSFGGGGAGGCIAIDFNSNTFAGTISAYAGGGANYGGAGTIYLYTNTTSQASLTLDNGGQIGGVSTIQSSSSTSLTLRNGGIAYANGSISFANLVVGTNSMLATSNNTALSITANNITIQSGGTLSANTAGYGANSGSGEGHYSTASQYYPGSGGGNGGCGGSSISNLVLGGAGGEAYLYSPTAPGSGGGGIDTSIGGTGGGVIAMTVSGTLQVNGTLSANGGNGGGTGGGGGSGGSMDLSVGSLSGSGVISANGGSGVGSIGGGGGGGEIAVILTQSSSSLSNTFTGTYSAYGGGGATNGGAGTVYVKTNYNGFATLILDNGGTRGTNTPVTYSSSQMALTVRNGAVAVLSTGGGNEFFLSLNIYSNAWLMPGNSPGTVELSLGQNSSVQAGCGILANADGYGANSGSGAGHVYASSPFYPCSGGGHGGYGGFGLSNEVAGGITYDTINGPEIVGSGGGGDLPFSTGGSGGGSIYLYVDSGYTLQVNGAISANGGNGSGSGGGGGSGGAIYITTSYLTGSGSITANGGNGAPDGGGGGGGRIAILTFPNIHPSDLFTGTVTAYAGGGANYGGAGTIYYATNELGPAVLILDNNGNVGTNTSIGTINDLNVTVQNGAIGLLPSIGSWYPNSLLILSNSAMTALAPADFTLEANTLTIAAGGALYLDGCGNGAESGTGAGSYTGSVSGGGGHGGYGGGNPTGFGLAYDSIQAPTAEGSGGDNSVSGYPSTLGGSGGGAMILTSSGTVTVNGRLSANGLSGSSNAGGGSGGGLLLNVATLAGNGAISANGGAASGAAGGGGGGRIALICSADNFTGQFSANGGNATYPGGAGTIFTEVPGAETLTVNNGGIQGTNTPLSSSFSMPTNPFNLSVSGDASVVPLTPLPLLSNLTLAAGSTLTMPVAQSNLFIAALSNATVLGNLNVDRLGYPQLTGTGAGSSADDEGSGGGYGGNGAPSANGLPGGTNYGSATAPTAFGSGGGSGAPTVTGGSDGGGALRLSVGGTLTVSGNLSANGNAGLQDDSGGGSGGSIWITADALSGAGTISANGGNGVLYGGGGGGGGRIAIYALTNSFTGATNVNGGTGDSSGQPGTIFLSSVLPAFQVSSQSPTGVVMSTVSAVSLGLSDALNPASVSASDFTLITPGGTLAASNLTVAITGSASVQVNFPVQNLLGTYTIEATTLTNIFGVPLTPYAGTFTVSLPAISGTVTGTNGAPVADVLIQPNGGLTGVTTDVNGNYAFGVPVGWNGTVTPANGNFVFVPASISYTNVTASITNQDYLMVQTVVPTLAAGLSGGNLSLNWAGIPGVTYQLLWSTNLVNWQPMGNPVMGTNGPMQILLPTGANPDAFFELNASY